MKYLKKLNKQHQSIDSEYDISERKITMVDVEDYVQILYINYIQR